MNKRSKIENSVMQNIKNGKTYMKPKRYYSLITFLWISLIALSSVVSVYIFSIIFFWLRVSFARGPAYGARQNLSTLIGSFPWWLAILSAITLAVAIYLVRRHSSLYKIKLIIVIPATIIIIMLTGILVSYSSLPMLNIIHNQNSTRNSR